MFEPVTPLVCARVRVRILVLLLLLAGCAGAGTVPPAPSRDLAGPPPSYRKLIGAQLAQIVGSAGTAATMQLSPLRRVESFKGPAWLVCLRPNPQAKSLDRAIFIQDERIVDSRLAVRTDRCEEQPYEAFGAFSDSQKAIR